MKKRFSPKQLLPSKKVIMAIAAAACVTAFSIGGVHYYNTNLKETATTATYYNQYLAASGADEVITDQVKDYISNYFQTMNVKEFISQDEMAQIIAQISTGVMNRLPTDTLSSGQELKVKEMISKAVIEAANDNNNQAITGAQGTGKTTFLRSTIRFIPHEFSLRIQENQSELNLRYTYPDRNIVAFQETGTISAQEGLNFQKKSNGDVNIIGEIAEAMQTSHFIQTSTVASLFSLGTHHAKTAKALVHALANNLLELGMYKDKKDAIEMVADVVNIDCHLVNVKGNRHIERITEIIPIKDREYPSSFFMEDIHYKNRKEEAELKTLMDAPEYMRRVTDPELFEVKDILRWVPVTDADGKQLYNEWGFEVGKFVLVNGFSENMKNEIMSKLTKAEEEEFLHDLDMCEHVSDGTITPEVSEWMETVLSY